MHSAPSAATRGCFYRARIGEKREKRNAPIGDIVNNRLWRRTNCSVDRIYGTAIRLFVTPAAYFLPQLSADTSIK